MSTTYTRVASVLVTNTPDLNTGHAVNTIIDGDVILFDTAFNEVADNATVQTVPTVATVYVGLGQTGGGMAPSQPIQVRNIRKVTRSAYTPATPMVVTVGGIVGIALTEYIVKIIYRDTFAPTPGHSAPRSYAYTSDGTGTAASVANGLAFRINADKQSLVVASVNVADLVLTAKVIPYNAIDTYQRVTFDVATPYGFTDGATTLTVVGGGEGQGTGYKVKNMEQATKYDQRILWPIPSETTRATPTGTYNLVTIEHYHGHIGDMVNQAMEPLKTVIAFASTSATPSAKEAAFMVKLSSVVESADIFVL